MKMLESREKVIIDLEENLQLLPMFQNLGFLCLKGTQRISSGCGKLHYITLYYITHYMSEHQQINCIIFLTGGLPACLQNRFFSICQQLSEFDSIQLQLTDLLVDKIYLWKAVQK